MKNLSKILFGFLISVVCHAQFIEDFPNACIGASVRNPLPGHIVRVGKVTFNGNLSFVFPEQNTHSLQSVDLAQNAGLIGRGESPLAQRPTPPGFFVVGQVFVGDQNIEPIATCVSAPIAFESYRPQDYNFFWLDRYKFRQMLAYKNYIKWTWYNSKKWWRRDFDDIRYRYRHHHRKYRYRHDDWRDRYDRKGKGRREDKFRDRKGDRDDRRMRSRDKVDVTTKKDIQDWDRMDRDRNKGKGRR